MQSDKSDSISPDHLRRIHEIRDRFEAEFASDRTPRISDFLNRVPEEICDRLFRELLGLQLELGADCNPEELLKEHPEFSDIINTVFHDSGATRINDALSNDFTRSTDLPCPLDRYSIVRPIGTGGMGQVYLADQLSPVRRQVAIKVIKKGLDTDQWIARFREERQALAMCNIPTLLRSLRPV